MKLKNFFAKDILIKIFEYDITKYEMFNDVINEINEFRLWNSFSNSYNKERNQDLLRYWMCDDNGSDFISDKNSYSEIFIYIKNGPDLSNEPFRFINN